MIGFISILEFDCPSGKESEILLSIDEIVIIREYRDNADTKDKKGWFLQFDLKTGVETSTGSKVDKIFERYKTEEEMWERFKRLKAVLEL